MGRVAVDIQQLICVCVCILKCMLSLHSFFKAITLQYLYFIESTSRVLK